MQLSKIVGSAAIVVALSFSTQAFAISEGGMPEARAERICNSKANLTDIFRKFRTETNLDGEALYMAVFGVLVKTLSPAVATYKTNYYMSVITVDRPINEFFYTTRKKADYLACVEMLVSPYHGN